MKPKLDLDRIAKGLGAERRGPVRATSGFTGATQLLAEIEERFSAPKGGGRRTDPLWTERRLVPLTRQTLNSLEAISARVRRQRGGTLHPMQVAALLIEEAVGHLSAKDFSRLARRR